MTAYRLGLGAAAFPLLTAWAERQTLIKQVELVPQAQKEEAVVRPIYMHNVLPTLQGYASVSYLDAMPAMAPPVSDFDQAIILRDDGDNRVIFSPAAGKNYIYNGSNQAWSSVNPITPNSTLPPSWAYIQQRTFVYYPYTGLYEYNAGLGTFEKKVLKGVVATDILGVCAANNFLILYTTDRIYISSMVDLLDFVPSLATGASSGSITDLRGKIVAVLPLGGDIVVYSTDNAVGGQYSGNLRFPFVFKEIKKSGGLVSSEHVSYGNNSDVHYAWTTFGLQAINVKQAEVIFPELTDFISNKVLEDYVGGQLVQTVSANQLAVKLALVASRYVVLSYGLAEDQYSHALVLDLGFKRWGKLKINHVDCFNLQLPNEFVPIGYEGLTSGYEAYQVGYSSLTQQVSNPDQQKRDLAFLQADGKIKIVNFDFTDTTVDDDSILLLGKFEAIRGRKTQLNGIKVRTGATATNFALEAIASYRGDTWDKRVTPKLVSKSGDLERYRVLVTGAELTLAMSGTFNLSFVEIDFAVGGH